MKSNALTRVLIVDDVPTVRCIVRDMLVEAGFTRIDEAEDGEEAWQMILRKAGSDLDAYELVIADWSMPGMSGVDLLRSIRASAATGGTRFLMITSQGNDARIHDALRAGADACLVKPFSSSDLLDRIRRVLHS